MMFKNCSGDGRKTENIENYITIGMKKRPPAGSAHLHNGQKQEGDSKPAYRIEDENTSENGRRTLNKKKITTLKTSLCICCAYMKDSKYRKSSIKPPHLRISPRLGAHFCK